MTRALRVGTGNPHLVLEVGPGAGRPRPGPRSATTSTWWRWASRSTPRCPAGPTSTSWPPGRRRHRRCAPTSGAWASPGRAAPAPAPAAAAARRWGLVGDVVGVLMPGGRAEVRLAPGGTSRCGARPPIVGAVELGERRRGTDRTVLPGEDRPRRRDDPARVRRGDRELPRRAGPAGRHGRRRRGGRDHAAPPGARPAHLRGQGQGGRAARAGRGHRLRHRRVRQRADAGPAVQPGEAARPDGHRPHGRHPRHLRPERAQPGGQGPGRAGPAPLPAAAAAAPGGRPVPAGGRHVGGRRRPHRHPWPRRDAARGRPAPHRAPHPQARGRAAEIDRHRATQRKAQRRGQLASGRHRRLHERRQVDPAQPAHRRRRAGGGPPVRHPRRHHPPAGAAGRRAGPGDRHGGLHPQAAPPAGGGVPVHARRGRRRRPARPRGRRQRPRRRPATSGRCARCSARSAPSTCRSCWCSTRPTWRPAEAGRQAGAARGLGGVQRHHRRGRRAPSWRRSATGCGRSPPWSSWSSPTSGATSWPQPTGPARCWTSRRARVACTSAGASTTWTVGRFREYVVP